MEFAFCQQPQYIPNTRPGHSQCIPNVFPKYSQSLGFTIELLHFSRTHTKKTNINGPYMSRHIHTKVGNLLNMYWESIGKYLWMRSQIISHKQLTNTRTRYPQHNPNISPTCSQSIPKLLVHHRIVAI